MARKKSIAAAADPTVETITPAADLVQTEEPTTEPTAPAVDLPTEEPIKTPLTAEEKCAKVLEALARARAIRAEQLAADPNREKGKASKTVSRKEVLGTAMGDLSKIAARLQKNNCHEIADRLRGEIARIGASLAEGE